MKTHVICIPILLSISFTLQMAQAATLEIRAADVLNESATISDQDCVPQMIYSDLDGDGYGNPATGILGCLPMDNRVSNSLDCNDSDASVNPDATEICNGVDDNCSGIADENMTSTTSVVWKKSWGGNKDDVAFAIENTMDGGIIVAGKSQSNNGDVTTNYGKNDFWILKLSSSGQMVWKKTYGGSGDDVAYAVRKTVDGGYMVAGSSSSTDGDVSGNHGLLDAWLLRLDSLGNVVWNKCFGGSGNDLAYELSNTSDGGFAFAGYTKSNDGDISGGSHASGDYWIAKINSLGDLVWSRTYGGSGYDFAHAMQQAGDGGYYLSGYARSTDGDVQVAYGQEDMWILKLDDEGNQVWQKTYGGTGGEGAGALTVTTDGGCILAGITHSFNMDVQGNHGFAHDYWVVKIDDLGNKQWAVCLGGTNTEDAHSIIQTSDGGYVVSGKGDSNDGDATTNNGGHDYWLVKLNAAGTIQWQKSFGGSLDDEANGIVETSNGELVAAGYAVSNDKDVSGNHGGSDFWILRCVPPSMSFFYADQDGDTYGNKSISVTACTAPPGYVANSADCDDSNASAFPGASETCNGIDDDCDSYIDEDSLNAIISPLETVTICTSSYLTFTCNTDPSFSYQWLDSGVLIDGATNSTYTTNNGGEYSVLITKGQCSANSATTILKTNNGDVTVQPKGTTSVCSGTSVSFSIPESPGMMLQWYNSNGPIPNATSKVYNASTPGSYYVAVSDVVGCTFNTSSSTLENYPEPVTNLKVNGDLNICNTGSVKFTITLQTGSTYKWYKNNVVINGATKNSYTATSPGTYNALVTTSNGCTKYTNSKVVTGCGFERSGTETQAVWSVETYPNPSNGNFTLNIHSEDQLSRDATLLVINSEGQVIMSKTLPVSDGLYEENIILPDQINPGLYFLRVVMADKELNKTIVVSK